jgi:hypothetical protein
MRPLPLNTIVVFVAFETRQRMEGGRGDANHYMDFDPYLIRERYQQLHTDVRSLRLEQRLAEERGSSASRSVALARRGVLPLVLEVHTARRVAMVSTRVQGSSTPPLRRWRLCEAAVRRNAG